MLLQLFMWVRILPVLHWKKELPPWCSTETVFFITEGSRHWLMQPANPGFFSKAFQEVFIEQD